MPRDARAAVGVPIRAAGGAAVLAQPAEGSKLRRFAGVAYTGAPMRPDGWGIPIIVDLAGVKFPANQNRPVLRQHDHEQIVGHTDSIKVTDEGIEIEGVLSGEPRHTDTVTVPADNGFQWQQSIGATPIRLEYLEAGKEAVVNGRTVAGPMDISRETDLSEVSFVPLGADGDTSATVSASKGGKAAMYKGMLKAARTGGNVKAGKYNDDEIEKMTEDDAKAALKKCMADDEPPAKAADEPEKKAAADDEEKKTEAARAARLAASRKAEADELDRCDAIKAAAHTHGVEQLTVDGKPAGFVAHAIRAGWSADRAEREAMAVRLEKLRADRPGAGVGGPTVYVTNKPELNEAVIEAAILHAHRHQLRLDDPGFYTEATPDGKGTLRRVPQYVEADARRPFRERYTDQVQQAAHTLFRGRVTLHEVFNRAFAAMGSASRLDLKSQGGVEAMLREWDHLERGPAGFRAEGASALSITNILSNVLNKFALQGYLFVEQAWRQIAAIKPVNDFKPTKSINLLGDVMYKQFGPMGELEHATLGDQAFANQAAPFGRIVTIPWTYIVNDDLSMLSGVPMKIGQGAGLALNDQFWTLWKNMAAGTVNGDDGVAFWRTTSDTSAASKKAGTAYKANKLSGASSAFANAALKLAKALFDNQIDPNGNPLGFDGMKPTLLFPPTLWADVMTAMSSPALVAIALGSSTPTVQGGNNVWQQMFEPVMSRYLENANYGNSTTGWSLLFNPAALAVIEVCFLNGVDTPAVLTAGPDYNFDRPGISIRGTMPFGCNQQNFRGGVYAVGA